MRASPPSSPRIRLKRAYAARSDDDGERLLVERLWPRGVRRSEAGIDHWFKTLAPSPELRRWYGHAVDRWPEFRRRYLAELDATPSGEVDELIQRCRSRPVTFVFAARDEQHNSALVLRDWILEKIGRR